MVKSDSIKWNRGILRKIKKFWYWTTNVFFYLLTFNSRADIMTRYTFNQVRCFFTFMEKNLWRTIFDYWLLLMIVDYYWWLLIIILWWLVIICNCFYDYRWFLLIILLWHVSVVCISGGFDKAFFGKYLEKLMLLL